MAQDFRFASLRRRFNLTSPSMPNLCGPEVSDRASSVLEPNRAADADAAAHNDSPDNNSIAGDGEETPHQNVVPGEKSLKLEGLTNNAQAIDPIEELKRIFSCEQIDNPDQGKEDDDTIEEVPRASTPRLYQEPFDALCFRLQDQLGIAGYPRLVLPGETTFGAWDGFANDTQRRLNDVMHRYLGRTDLVLALRSTVC